MYILCIFLNNSIETQANIKIGVEELVGKIGDKTLYRKAYHVTDVSFKGNYTVDKEINKNIATMIKAEGSLASFEGVGDFPNFLNNKMCSKSILTTPPRGYG